MQILLLLQTMGVNITDDVQEVKSQQASLFASEAPKKIFCSKVHTMEQDETCSRFFFQKVHKANSVLSGLKEEDNSVTSFQSDILRISKCFYASHHQPGQVCCGIGASPQPNQTCVILGRLISESLALLRNMITYVQDGRVNACLISLDQEKAFDKISTHTETNTSCTWRPINSVKDILSSARNLLVFQNKELTSTKCCRLAHSKVQDHVLRDALKPGDAATKT
eukprot:g44499.t1